jgi:signal transduction histidine kinase
MTTEPSTLLLASGLVTWAIVVAGNIAHLVARPAAMSTVIVLGIAFAVFAIAFIGVAGTGRLGLRGLVAAVATQVVAALVIIALGQRGFTPALVVVVAAQAPLALMARDAIACIAIQTIALVAIAVARWGTADGLVASGIYVGFQLFAVGAAHLAERESAARRELERAHAELVATQALLADSTRVAERLRISRELHDALGHHLTALCLQLEVAKNVADGRATEPVEAAHAITKRLLAELRDVVGAMRADEPLDLARALRMLVAGVPRPKVHLKLPQTLEISDPALAHTLFRCVQEALTNAVRHARADNIWIELASDDGRLAIVARDDGCGTDRLERGNGLSGLFERVEGLGGRVEIDSSAGRGLTLRAFVPARSAT